MVAADLVLGEIQRLDNLVSDFLAFAKPQPLRTKQTDPNHLVQGVFELIRPEADAKGVELVLELSDRAEPVDVEEERMRQVLLNLTRNAIEAVAPNQRVIVRTRAADVSGDISIEVEDNGPGFPEDAPVFDAFYTTKEHGTGLGLAIAHRIVTDHGGSLAVSSEPGRTCFSVTLPPHTDDPESPLFER